MSKEKLMLFILVVGTAQVFSQQRISGKVTSEQGNELSDVFISTKEGNSKAFTKKDGTYIIEVTKNEKTLIFQLLGYETKQLSIKRKNRINATLLTESEKLSDMIITGIVKRKKESYTGSVVTIKADELKAIGNQNIIQSIKTIAPSFIILENNQLGSNPNALPNIEIRGKSSIQDNNVDRELGVNPNQPLFVLDGFETDLRTIVDLDMNRVKSVTLLKDAASAALYGANAANGVVVIETLQPKIGKLNVSYTYDFTLDIPDLSDYNLMNAEEKLEFERLSGVWSKRDDLSKLHPYDKTTADSIYNSTLADVRRGVNTYWLKKPLRIGFTQRHSLYTNGGSEAFRFGAGINFKNQEGVMIGSKRQNWGGNLDLIYRRNKLNISNKLYVNSTNADESPYGSFRKFAQANPYYKPVDSEGKVTKYLEEEISFPSSGMIYNRLGNPLYSDQLNNKNNTKTFLFQNNIKAIYTINSSLRIQGGLQLKRTYKKQKVFVSPEEVEFENKNAFEKGRYTSEETTNSQYSGNLMLTYAKVFNGKHALNANIRADIEENRDEYFRVIAIGFPEATNGNPSFSFGYEPNGKPLYVNTLYRRNNFLASMNYGFDKKYLLDATFRMDGSTVFGSNKKYSPFWAIGLGWNIHNQFNFNKNTVNLIRIRGNIGTSGNQNFNTISTTSSYEFYKQINRFGQGLNLSQLANEDLQWQKTLQANIGLDVTLFNNRLNATLEIYKKKTDPLIARVNPPPSTGIKDHPINTGRLDTKGLEVILRFSPIYNLSKGIIWTLGATATTYSSEYNGFKNTLDRLNEQGIKEKSLTRFYDGRSPDDLWAVRSLGIDPATGREVFLKPTGEPTFVHDYDHETVVGNKNPKIQGVLSNNISYKGFSLGINFRYRLGGDIFNYALYNKIENIAHSDFRLNQDKRALFDRWKKPGDKSKFKSIVRNVENTPISSRFVQRENILIGESINIGYRTHNKKWLKKMKLSDLRVNVYMNDFFRISSLKAERGIDYPFARSVSFSIKISF